jgi:diaminohydroxyphosphoribosylaminopyrimidine deaminase / 5-amino-6-(5-phosphoribosylamino)uracil reductase
MATPAEIAAMRRAIAVSAAGLGTTSPNPPVGCVVIGAEGQIIGEGFHERKGEAHAEAQALAAAGDLAHCATAVVTLEPCNHQGRTPPCRQALIDAGIRRVVIALADPTSRGEGGTAALRAAGIDVETDVLADEAMTVLGTWLAATRTGRPIVIWPYLISGGSVSALLPGDMSSQQILHVNADAVLHPDGSVSEAIPGSHGKGILNLPTLVPGNEPGQVATALYEAGVRILLLSGELSVAAPFLAEKLIDRVIAYLPDGKASQRPDMSTPWPFLPPGFAITKTDRIAGFVRVDAQRDGSL